MMADSAMDPFAEVERLKNVIARLEGQNQELRSKHNNDTLTTTHSASTSNLQSTFNLNSDRENGNLPIDNAENSKVFYQTAKTPKNVNGLLKQNFSAGDLPGSQLTPIESLDILEWSDDEPDKNDSWLYESPVPASPTPVLRWLRRDVDSAQSELVKRTLCYTLEEISRGGRAVASDPSMRTRSTMLNHHRQQEEVAASASPFTQRVRSSGSDTKLAFGATTGSIDSRTFTRPKRKQARPLTPDDEVEQSMDEIKLRARLQEESLRASISSKERKSSARSIEEALGSSSSSVGSARVQDSLSSSRLARAASGNSPFGSRDSIDGSSEAMPLRRSLPNLHGSAVPQLSVARTDGSLDDLVDEPETPPGRRMRRGTYSYEDEEEVVSSQARVHISHSHELLDEAEPISQRGRMSYSQGRLPQTSHSPGPVSHGAHTSRTPRTSHSPGRNAVTITSSRSSNTSRTSHSPGRPTVTRTSHSPGRIGVPRTSHSPARVTPTRTSHSPGRAPTARASHSPGRAPTARASHSPGRAPTARASHSTGRVPTSRTSHSPGRLQIARANQETLPKHTGLSIARRNTAVSPSRPAVRQSAASARGTVPSQPTSRLQQQASRDRRSDSGGRLPTGRQQGGSTVKAPRLSMPQLGGASSSISRPSSGIPRSGLPTARRPSSGIPSTRRSNAADSWQDGCY